ncbi:Cytochrome c-type biogenesis protein ResA [hydrothermal vent metagenome]|uniref:Cytochrome c-type biogenesis protein ResA n=1 Tax=hydrothermal vent metagenome TaxID=652676 RepID=A0A3B1ARZ7_9ZZZZ
MRLQNMYGKSTAVFVVIAGVLALGAGIGLSIYLNQSSTSTQTATIKSTSLIGKQRPDFSMGDVEGEKRSISEFDGKVLIVNFWATWCPPCRREIPALIALQEKYKDKGFTIVGVALDSQQAAIDFVDPMGINYPILVGETDGIAISQAYGNELTVLPYTVVIDRKGIIRHAFAREITLSEAEELIKPFL